ncbi:Abscisic acid-insensitive 5-like protein 5 [Apostasia shenzhenica]|uniref:Abscisic acid-insensitive 5-like protein 5 n=1 Tax=Apostasia shenzhenica TaxID=1088818 RepID=A0A2I0A372_9ASPA|nr:Abscisic acid-insensitive 5-like protein 5 [Apostasia shenzhenica]
MSFRGTQTDGKDVRQLPVAAAPLARQSSVYSLTFDEFQSTMGSIGKDFGSMNMDEFLKNIWTAEESQTMVAAVGGAVNGGSMGFQRQGSITLPRTLSQKTVDEVWRDLFRDNAGSSGGSDFPSQQLTLGEMTLEEFLVRAGVVREENNTSASRPVLDNVAVSSNNDSSVYYGGLSASGNKNTAIALDFTHGGRINTGVMPSSLPGKTGANLAIPGSGSRAFAAQLPVSSSFEVGNQQGVRGGDLLGMVDPGLSNGLLPGMVGLGAGAVTSAAAGSPANQIASDRITKGNAELASLSPLPYFFSGGLRGRKSNGAVEKVVERRQRRMIKNRESAARSRARKQAYTMELEAEVAKLKEQNQVLQKKQTEIMKMQENQIIEVHNQQRGPKKICLRRTLTGPWLETPVCLKLCYTVYDLYVNLCCDALL